MANMNGRRYRLVSGAAGTQCAIDRDELAHGVEEVLRGQLGQGHPAGGALHPGGVRIGRNDQIEPSGGDTP